MGFKKINSLKVSLFTHLVVALVFSIIFSFAVQNIAGHVKETIWLEYIDADELYEFQNKYSSQFGGVISVPQVMNSEMDKADQFWVGGMRIYGKLERFYFDFYQRLYRIDHIL